MRSSILLLRARSLAGADPRAWAQGSRLGAAVSSRRALAQRDDGALGPGSDPRRAHARGPAPTVRSPPKLLIVDDDALMTNLLPRKLRSAFVVDLHILTAASPEEATLVMLEARPDIILSDYNLRAERTGLDVLAEAARVLPQGVRILFSGHTASEIGDELAVAPIHGFIEKPFRLDELAEPVARVVREASGFELGLASRREGP